MHKYGFLPSSFKMIQKVSSKTKYFGSMGFSLYVAVSFAIITP